MRASRRRSRRWCYAVRIRNAMASAGGPRISVGPYSTELNAIERVWLYLRERFLSHPPLATYDDILEACCAA
jgi:transposase